MVSFQSKEHPQSLDWYRLLVPAPSPGNFLQKHIDEVEWNGEFLFLIFRLFAVQKNTHTHTQRPSEEMKQLCFFFGAKNPTVGFWWSHEC